MGFPIKVENISKKYGDLTALQPTSFEVKSGELFGLIGPDGAGKTSLIRILTTLLLPNTGRAFVEGYDTVKDYKQIRNIIGYMPGRFSLYQDLSIEENLMFFATIFGTTVEENYALIHDIYCQIEPFKNRLAGRLSGGMKQKLALCCALIHKPKVLFLDEPTTGVDVVSRREFWDILNGLKAAGITILVSTPYMDEASLCDRVALMQDGKVLNIDSPENIRNNYKEKIFAVRSANIYKLLKDLEAFEFTKTVYPFGQYLHLTSKDKMLLSIEVKKYLVYKEHKDIEVLEVAPTIEDVFMAMM